MEYKIIPASELVNEHLLELAFGGWSIVSDPQILVFARRIPDDNHETDEYETEDEFVKR